MDENLNPFTGDWISRTRLKNWEGKGWSKDKGGVERGKDYNHSGFCDLVLSDLLGIKPSIDNFIEIRPLYLKIGNGLQQKIFPSKAKKFH